jgi:hypothetical protein
MIRSKTLIALGLAVGVVPLASGAMAAGPFDGPYTGYQRQTKTDNGGHCQNINRDNLRATVTDNTIEWKWGGVPLKAAIAPDGSFSTSAAGWASRGASGAFAFSGKFAGGSLEADVGSSACAAHISMKKA